MNKFDYVSKALNDRMFTRKIAMEKIPIAKKEAMASMNMAKRAKRRAKIKQIWSRLNREFIYSNFDVFDWSLDAELSLNCPNYWIYAYHTNLFNHAYLSQYDILDVCHTYDVNVNDLHKHFNDVISNINNDRYYDYYYCSVKKNKSMLACFADIERHVKEYCLLEINQQKFEQMSDELLNLSIGRYLVFHGNNLVDPNLKYELELDELLGAEFSSLKDDYEFDDYMDLLPECGGDQYEWLTDKNMILSDLINICKYHHIDYFIFRIFCMTKFNQPQGSNMGKDIDTLFSPINEIKFKQKFESKFKRVN